MPLISIPEDVASRFLIDALIDPDKAAKEIKEYYRQNNICTYSEFLKAVKTNNLTFLKENNFLKEYMTYEISHDIQNQWRKTQNTNCGNALAYAVLFKHYAMVEYLIQQDPYEAKTAWSPIVMNRIVKVAIENDDTKMVKLLLAYDVDISTFDIFFIKNSEIKNLLIQHKTHNNSNNTNNSSENTSTNQRPPFFQM